MFSSIRSKILSLLIGLAITSVGIATWQHISSSLEARQEELKASAVSMGQLIGIKIVGPLLKRKEEFTLTQNKELQGWVNNTPDVSFLAIYDPSGERIFKYQSNQPVPESSTLNNSFLSDLLSSDESFIAREIEGQELYDTLVPLRLYGTQLGIIRMGLSVSRLYRDQKNIIYKNTLYGIILVTIIGLIGYWLTHYIVDPIKNLAQTAAQFGQGNLTVRAKTNSRDEIQKLGEQFNTMAGKIQSQIDDLRTIEQINRKISSELRPELLHDQIVHILRQTWDIPYVALLLKKSENQRIEAVSGLQVRENLDHLHVEHKLEELVENNSDTVIHASRAQLLDFIRSIFTQDTDNLKDGNILVLKQNDLIQGYLILAKSNASFTDSENNLFPMLAHQISIALQNAKNYVRAVTDDLTQLYTRRFFNIELENKINPNPQQPISLAMIDIDDFKHYNDTYGHPAGDVVLKRLARTFESNVRTSDVKEANRISDTVARYGGEEFAIILPETGLKEARIVGERIVKSVASIPDFEEQVTISLGIAEYRHDESQESFLSRADQALYRAKNTGKNQVCTNA